MIIKSPQCKDIIQDPYETYYKQKTTDNNTFISLIIYLLFTFCLSIVNHLINGKNTAKVLTDFYTKNPNIDVLFLGASHIGDSIIPLELWKDYGITSYNLAISDSRIPTSYWVLKNALRYVKPKVVVLEAAHLYDEKTTFISSHALFNSIPLGFFKYQAAKDLFDGDKELIIEAMIPFVRYHNNWDNIPNNNNSDTNNYSFGYGAFYNVQVKNIPEQMSDNPFPVNNISTEYVKKIIDLCKENEITVLFYSFPFLATEESRNDMSNFQTIAEENGITFVTPDSILQHIDPLSDFFDHYEGTSHANFSGALKATRFIGQIIQENHLLPKHENDKTIKQWDSYYRNYYKAKVQSFAKSNDLVSYFTKCFDDDFIYFIEINDPKIKKSEFHTNLLNNIGLDPSRIEQDVPSLYIIKDNRIINLQRDYLKHEDYSFDSEMGYVTFVCKEDENLYQILLDNQVIYTASYSDTYQADIRITVIEKENHQFVDSVFWNIEGDVSVGNGKRK